MPFVRRFGTPTMVLLFTAVSLMDQLVPTAMAHPAAAMTQRTRAHHVVFQVDSDDLAMMKHAISGAINVARFYGAKHESVSIEIVANAGGLKMLRADTSPVLEGIRILRTLVPNVVLSACGSTKQIMEQEEGHSLAFVDGAQIVPFGVGRVIDLEEAGWAYIHA